MSEFEVRPLGRFAGSSAAIRRPKEIAYFSYDSEHQFHLDDRSLRYYYTPQLGADLSKGFDTFQQLDDIKDDHLDSLLKTIVALEKETEARCEAHFITWRGMMTKIMSTPNDNYDGFEMNATYFQGTIFIEENHQHKIDSRSKQYRPSPHADPHVPSQELMSYWGYKFEVLSVLPGDWDSTPRDFIESREDHVVNNHAQYCSVVKTGIGKARMILGGEVDAIWDCKPDDKDRPINWVELKTSAELETEKDMRKYERKLMKFWLQSFLLGVPKIIVGFRNKSGILQRLEELETNQIPIMVKKLGRASWDGNLSINFTATFLQWLKDTITTEGVWRIRRRSQSTLIEVFKEIETGHGDILSEEFLQWRNRGATTVAEAFG
ncbi:decapping endonuclease targeting mRNA [Bachmanniomyces sp. S44760]|nr:decapping endonuclease targeting mRNA [Bachmanniomyces sp. S44760]